MPSGEQSDRRPGDRTGEELEALDAELARLLERRIALLAERAASAPRPGSHEPRASEGPSGFVWRGVADLTAAAARALRCRLRRKSSRPRRVTIIGRRGSTGGFFARRLDAAGHRVDGFGRSGWSSEGPAMLREAELVLVSVPPASAPEVIRRAASHMRPEAALADVTSVKLPAFRAMMESHPGPVVGLHPMFGPGAESFLAQVVVVCHGRMEESYRWLLDEIEADGGTLVVSTPEEHDRVMIAVQAIRHFATMALGRFLAEEGVDLARTLQFASPAYRLEIDLVGRLFAQDPSLYIDIMLASPERTAAIGRLAETCSRLAREAHSLDRNALLAEFDAARAVLGREPARALEESNRLLELFGAIVVARAGREGGGQT